MGKLTMSMAILNSKLLVNTGGYTSIFPFSMVFIWFSYGFLIFPGFPHGFPKVSPCYQKIFHTIPDVFAERFRPGDAIFRDQSFQAAIQLALLESAFPKTWNEHMGIPMVPHWTWVEENCGDLLVMVINDG